MGALSSFINYNFPSKPKWSTNQIPDLSGKVIIVTGGNSGIGYETTKALLKHNAKVYILSRTPSRAQDAIKSLKEETNKEAYYIEMDLADLGSVKRGVDVFLGKETKLDVLINNAGVMLPKPDAVTKDGFDYQFGINVLGHYYLTTLLHPLLQQTAQNSKEPVRIINLSSHGHILCKGIDWETLKDGPKRQKSSMMDLYNQSKFANMVLSSEFAKRYSGENIISNAVHPGLIATDLARDMPQFLAKFLSLFFYKPDMGALTSLYAATAPENANANGKYFAAWARIGEAHPATFDPDTGKKLWEWCESQVGSV